LYVLYAIEPYQSNAVRNELHRFGDIEFVTTVRCDYATDSFDIYELEFKACTSLLVAAVMRNSESWGSDLPPILSEVLETDCDELWVALNAPVPEKPSLTWCVRRFKMYYPESWLDYWSAVGQCNLAADDFLAFLEAYGAIAKEQIASGYARLVKRYLGDRKYASADFPAGMHVVVGIGRIRIDWTRRQYIAEASVPTIWINHGVDDVFPPSKTADSV
jgi:hypothetical protein